MSVEDRATMYLIMTFVALIIICGLVVSCASASASRGCQQRDGCPSANLRRWQRYVSPPEPVFKMPEDANVARYMLERWPVEPIYRMRGE